MSYLADNRIGNLTTSKLTRLTFLGRVTKSNFHITEGWECLFFTCYGEHSNQYHCRELERFYILFSLTGKLNVKHHLLFIIPFFFLLNDCYLSSWLLQLMLLPRECQESMTHSRYGLNLWDMSFILCASISQFCILTLIWNNQYLTDFIEWGLEWENMEIHHTWELIPEDEHTVW